jgi:hypothetical protein
VALPNGTLLSSGCSVGEVTIDTLVGNGGKGGLPSVAIVVMRDFKSQYCDKVLLGGDRLTPVASGVLWFADVTVGDCGLGNEVIVTV